MKYDELLRDLIENESQYIRQLNLILKVNDNYIIIIFVLVYLQVFQPVFVDNSELFSCEEVEQIFDPVADVYDLSVQLLASIEEIVEMTSEMEESTRYPQIGFCFEEIAEVHNTSHDLFV